MLSVLTYAAGCVCAIAAATLVTPVLGLAVAAAAFLYVSWRAS